MNARVLLAAIVLARAAPRAGADCERKPICPAGQTHNGRGCCVPLPPLDRDRDGIPDVVDQCPREPEDRDGHDDRDGCPDPDVPTPPTDGAPTHGDGDATPGSAGTSEDLAAPTEPEATGADAPNDSAPVTIDPITITATRPSARRLRGVARLDVARDHGPSAWLAHVGTGVIWRDHLQVELLLVVAPSFGWQLGVRWYPLTGALRPSLAVGPAGVLTDSGLVAGIHGAVALEWIFYRRLGLGVIAETGLERYLAVPPPLANHVWLSSAGLVIRP